MIFIFMTVFQLAGALILLGNHMYGSDETVIKNCFPGSNFVNRDDNNNCIIPKKMLQESALKIYLNIVAFFDLVVGYSMAVLYPNASLETSKPFFWFIILTFGLIFLEYCITVCITKIRYAEDKQLPYDYLKKFGVDTFITNKEIDDMFDNIIKK